MSVGEHIHGSSVKLGLDLEDDMDEMSGKEFKINRSVYNEIDFESQFLKKTDSDPESLCHKYFSNCECSAKKFWAFVCRLIPILVWIPKYKVKTDLLRDVAGGITVGIMHIPQGMAYGMLTTLPAIYGLYVSFIPVIAYCFLGTSRHISIGSFAIVCLMSGEAIESQVGKFSPVTVAAPMGTNGTQNGTLSSAESIESYRVEVAVALTFAVGAVQLLLGTIRMGFLTIYLSDPLVSGFTTGAAFHILSSQVRHFLGLTVPAGINSGAFALFKLYIYFFEHISEVNISALIIGVICTILLFSLKYLNQRYQFRFPIPAELIVVVLGSGISYGVGFNKQYGTPILKSVPKGLPPLSVPDFSIMIKMVTEGITIGIVAFAINVSVAKSFAKKNDYEIDSNQELISYGISNIISSFFSCVPSAASLSRSLIQESLGSTQVTGFIAVVFVGLVLVSIAPLFQPLPNAVLAAIVLVALKGLFKQFAVLKSLWKISKIDALIWFASFLAVFLLGVDYGLAVGIIIALLSVVGRTSRPSYSILGRIPGSEMYKCISKYNAIEVPRVKIFQYKASLYYANLEYFQSMLSTHTYQLDLQKSCRVTKGYVNEMEKSEEMTSSEEITSDHSFHLDPPEKKNGDVVPNNVAKRSNSIAVSVISETPDLDSKGEWHLVDRRDGQVIILDLSQCAFIDSMGVTALGNIVTDRQKSNTEVYLANCSENVLGMLETGGFLSNHGSNRIFMTVHDAVVHCLADNTLKQQLSPSISTQSRELSPSPEFSDDTEAEDSRL